jgi:hypothetical protein
MNQEIESLGDKGSYRELQMRAVPPHGSPSRRYSIGAERLDCSDGLVAHAGLRTKVRTHP